jgi:hypothetical protein
MITFNCSCGKKYQLPDRLAGREVRCNQCGNALIIPNPELTESTEPETEQITEQTYPAEKSVAPATTPQHGKAQWGEVPVPDGEKNEHSPIVSGWATGPYQKGSSCILTIVLVLLGACSAFFAGFLAGSALQRRFEPPHHTNISEPDSETNENGETDENNEAETFGTETAISATVNWKNGENSLTLFAAAQTADGK